jgi:NAD(P)-dependent dehydrogenase (short-subunit alcohol dehydrogenase family)
MRILVVGGTGGFGSTICRLLEEDGHAVTAASRTIPQVPNAAIAHVVLDRSAITPDDLIPYDLVVDAAGPFQGQDYGLVDAAVSAGVHILDIADDRGYVSGISSRNAAAIAAGVVVVSGASSVPGLSSAAALEMSSGMDVIERVETSISASAAAVFGRSVLAAMLTGAGKPVPWRNGMPTTAMTAPRHVRISSPRGDLHRQVLICDAPDLDLVSDGLPGDPEIRFRAGSEIELHNASMRLIAATVKSGLASSGMIFARMANLARRLTTRWGSGRSGMLVEVTGRSNGAWTRRWWSLVAENGMGPMIPCLVVPVIVRAIESGAILPGARSAAFALTTGEILRRLPETDHDVTVEEETLLPVYQVGSGSAWDRYAPAVRRMHDIVTTQEARGWAKVQRGRSPLAHLVCAVMGFPASAEQIPVTVRFDVQDGEETWTRRFGERSFHSVIRARPSGVEERFGPMRFRFILEEKAGGLRMIPDGWSFLRIPMPSFLTPDGIAEESENDEGRFAFDVPIRIPGIGLMVHYTGTLEVIQRTTGR